MCGTICCISSFPHGLPDFLKNGFQMEYSYAPYQTKKWPLPEFRPRTSEEYITKAMSMIGISDKDAAE